MDTEIIKKELANPGTVLIDVDPMPYLEIGYPEGAICHPISMEPWEEILESMMGKNHNAIAVYSSFKPVGEYASRLATEYGIPVKFTFSEGLDKWSSMGLPVTRIKSMDVKELERDLNQFNVIDVREREELKSGFIHGSINIPLSEIDSALFRLDVKEKYAVICAHGNRSREASKILSEYGFDARTVNGGMSQWIIKKFSTKY